MTSLVSRSTRGDVGDESDGLAYLSSNGRWVSFESNSDNLVPNDTAPSSDQFVRDRHAQTTALISAHSLNGESVGYSGGHSSLSRDGRWIAFWSHSRELGANDTNEVSDVFVLERR